MRYLKIFFFLLAIFLTPLRLAPEVLAQVPQMIPYTGVIEVSGLPFNGPGQFKFAILGAASNSLWSNDNSSLTGSEPLNFVTLPVNDGIFTVKLGDTTFMETIPVDVFDVAQTFLRVWFNDGINDFQELSPDRQLVSVPYAYRASVADSVLSEFWSQGVDPLHIFRGTGAVFSGFERVGINTPVPNYHLDVKGDTLQLSLERILNLTHENQFDFRINDHNLEINPRQQAGDILFFASLDSIPAVQTGNVGIGTLSPAAKLHVIGSVICSAGCTSSSRELKHDIRTLKLDEALSALQALRPTRFVYNHSDEEEVGFIAEEVPALVAKKGRKGLDAMDIVAVLTRVVQQQQKEIEDLKARIESAQ